MLRNIEIVQLLLDNGAPVNAQSRSRNTPLHMAARSNSVDIVNLLLEKGASGNTQNNSGNTPLHNAVQKSKVEMVKALLQHNVDVRITNNRRKTALDCAKTSEIRNLFSECDPNDVHAGHIPCTISYLQQNLAL